MPKIVKQGFFHFDWYKINVIEVETPEPFREGVVYNCEEDVYTIVLGCRLSPSRKKEAFDHAMKHILKEDFFKYDVQQIEKEAHI